MWSLIKLQEGKGKADPFADDAQEDEDDDDAASKEPLKTTFELNDTLFAEAELEETDTVYLWLGVRYVAFPDTSTKCFPAC
jgi:hypothetical protein